LAHDLTGRPLAQIGISAEPVIDLSDQPGGMDAVMLQTEQRPMIQRIIKQ